MILWDAWNLPVNYLLACQDSFPKYSKDMIISLFPNYGLGDSVLKRSC